jgi:hypothetical protein
VIGDLPDVIERSRVLVAESTLFVQDTRVLIERGNITLENMAAGLEKVTRTLDVITTIANQIEGDVPEIVTAVRRSAISLETLFRELVMIVENFRHAEGTVKRLITDPEAYEKLLATLDNVERITEEVDWMLRVDVKPVAHNVKIFTDKVARDPAIFIRSLLRPEPPIKPMPCCFGRGLFATPSFPRRTIIDGEVVEILSEVPVSTRNVSQQRRTASPMHYETVIPAPSEGRIVNVDPRYSDF